MRSYLKNLEELRRKFEVKVDESSGTDDPALLVSISNWKSCIVVIDKCIEIFKLSEKQVVQDMNFFIMLVPDWVKNVPEGLDPTMYGTGSFDEDMKINKKYNTLLDTYIRVPVPEEKKKAKGIKNWQEKLDAIG